VAAEVPRPRGSGLNTAVGDVGVFVPLPTYLVDVGVMARIAEELGFAEGVDVDYALCLRLQLGDGVGSGASTRPATPAITLVEVSRLFREDLLIEIEAVAAARETDDRPAGAGG
jgi:hypothetical protein